MHWDLPEKEIKDRERGKKKKLRWEKAIREDLWDGGLGKKSFVSGGGCRGEESWQRLPWEKKEGGGGNNKKSKGKEGFSLMAGQWEGNRLHTDKRKAGGVRCQDKEGGPPLPPFLFFHPSETEKRAEGKDHPLGTNGANYLFLSFFARFSSM